MPCVVIDDGPLPVCPRVWDVSSIPTLASPEPVPVSPRLVGPVVPRTASGDRSEGGSDGL